MSSVKCQVSFLYIFLQIVGVSHGRVYYQQGLRHLVLLWPSMLLSNHVKLYIAQYGSWVDLRLKSLCVGWGPVILDHSPLL